MDLFGETLHSSPNGSSGRARASILASQIELDIAAGHFDETLDKYRPEKQRRSNLTVTKLFEGYRNYRARLMTGDRGHIGTQRGYHVQKIQWAD